MKTPSIRHLITLPALLALLGAASMAVAQPTYDGRAKAVDSLVACRALGDAARLACYDDAVAKLQTAEAAGDIVVVDREQATKVRRQAFGFSMPSLSVFDRGVKPEDTDNLVAKIERASRTKDGKWIFDLEGGQTWRQIDSAELSRNPKPGVVATISRAALGSFKLNIGGATSIRVHRDN